MVSSNPTSRCSLTEKKRNVKSSAVVRGKENAWLKVMLTSPKRSQMLMKKKITTLRTTIQRRPQLQVRWKSRAPEYLLPR